ncbi:PilW family protein [Massilia haematophila]|uniref:PilW family protein n=1 Tax=Massilia haematophila TaxID=457923 RepID=A0ABV7PGU3_9BURK
MSARPRQQGMSIAELLVAMSLGLGVLLAGSTLLTGANAAYVGHADAAGIDDGGRYALELIGRAVRQGAFADIERYGAAGPGHGQPASIGGLDNHSIGKTSFGIDSPLPGAVNGSDVLAVRYAGAGAGPDGDGSVLNCAGFPVHDTEDGWSIFYVARNGDGVAELRCKYRGTSNWSADAVVSNVDGFQVLYGIDSDTPRDGVANRYVNAGALAALDAALVLSGANPAALAAERNEKTWWKRVVSVKVALLLHGERPLTGPAPPARYELFGTEYGSAHGSSDPGVSLQEAVLAARDGPRPRRLFTAVYAAGAALP